jgi:hypothetical protein
MGAAESRMYRQSFEQIFTEVQNALIACKFKVKAANPQTGQIAASAGMSMASYGESIEVYIARAQGGVQVTIKSTPYTMDWGKSKKNVQNFFAALDHRVSRMPVTTQDTISPQTYQARTYPSTVVALPKIEADPSIPVALAVLNGIVTFALAFFYMPLWDILGYFVLIIAVMLFMGAALIASRNFKTGAILVGIGGGITIPLGILGIIAASRAWSYSKTS